MKIWRPSPMGIYAFTFRLLCFVCCIIAITSYKAAYHLPDDDRNERAVTEWRFRRNFNYAYDLPFVPRARGRKYYLRHDEGNDFDQDDGSKFHEKKFIIPQIVYPHREK